MELLLPIKVSKSPNMVHRQFRSKDYQDIEEMRKSRTIRVWLKLGESITFLKHLRTKKENQDRFKRSIQLKCKFLNFQLFRLPVVNFKVQTLPASFIDLQTEKRKML